ncbi:hypothetical protein [Bacillus sp. 7705b]|uniref:hypothetical protein n=1 Tax=Bacillus sp. 7705b TaxID=2028568 RepID=UPI000BAE2BEF|nr:hypothetical protein [Bacillus sp. 7705b]PAY11824.1 hypothetical protein CJU60_17545 [Bacillus sp. 7705b]
MGALFLFLKSAENPKKQHKTKKLVEKTSFSLQAEHLIMRCFLHGNRQLAVCFFCLFDKGP